MLGSFEAVDHCLSLGFHKSGSGDKDLVQVVFLGSNPRKQSEEVR